MGSEIGGGLSPKIFNLMEDAVNREWLQEVLGNKVAATGINSQIRVSFATLYANDGLVQSRDPDFLQCAFGMLVGLTNALACASTQSRRMH